MDGDPNTGEHTQIFAITGNHKSPGIPQVHNINLSKGEEYSLIFRETILDIPSPGGILENEIVTHEIGHQFGLGHGDSQTAGGVIPEHTGGMMGLMGEGNITTPNSSRFFIPRHINLIRSRVTSPGRN